FLPFMLYLLCGFPYPSCSGFTKHQSSATDDLRSRLFLPTLRSPNVLAGVEPAGGCCTFIDSTTGRAGTEQMQRPFTGLTRDNVAREATAGITLLAISVPLN